MIYATVVRHDDLPYYNRWLFLTLVLIWNQIVTGFNLYRDATCHVTRRHLPISPNRTQILGG